MRFAWLRTAIISPLVAAVIAAIAALIGAFLSWNASQSSVEQEYVALAMGILRDSESTQPTRNWAINVVSEYSPTEITPEMASGLLTGRAVLPAELDPDATRNEILECMQPLIESRLATAVPPAPLPEKDEDELAAMKNWAKFSIAQTGQLEKANGRIEAFNEIMMTCVSGPLATLRSTESNSSQ